MTIRELIEQLQEFDNQNAPVFMIGPDFDFEEVEIAILIVKNRKRNEIHPRLPNGTNYVLIGKK